MAEKQKYDYSKFASTMKNVMGTSSQAYERNPSRGSAYTIKYTRERAKEIIDSGDLNQLIELSQYYWYKSGIYRNFIMYYSTMLTFDTYVVPKLSVNPRKIKRNKLEDDFFEVVDFVESLNVPLEFSRIMYLLILNGAYYGLFRDYGDGNLVVQDLPISYCRTRFKNEYRNNELEFDLKYFDSIRDQNSREAAFNNFPPDFKSGYNQYKSVGETARWFEVPSEYGIAFFYLDQKPMLISAIPAVMSLESHRGLEEDMDAQALEKILAQKIPLNKDTGEPILEVPEIAALHQGVTNMLRNTHSVDVLTTFADLDLFSLQDTRQVLKDNLEKMERSVYVDAGVSKQIFNADGNLSLSASVKNDEAVVLDMVKMFDNWINYQINLRYREKKYYWDCRILPITFYNRQEMHDLYLKDAQFGYSKFLPGIAGGTKQSDIMGTTFIENEVLDLSSIMVPLKSSHTMSNKDAAGDEKGGAPVKKDEDKEDRSIENDNSRGGLDE